MECVVNKKRKGKRGEVVQEIGTEAVFGCHYTFSRVKPTHCYGKAFWEFVEKRFQFLQEKLVSQEIVNSVNDLHRVLVRLCYTCFKRKKHNEKGGGTMWTSSWKGC